MLTFPPNVKGQVQSFTSSGVWLCPPDVTSVYVTGFGGGGGGAGGSGSLGGTAGAGATLSTVAVAVVPGTTYLIIVGNGGAAGAANGPGAVGVETTFGTAAGTILATFSGASGGQIAQNSGACTYKGKGAVSAFAGNVAPAGGTDIAAGGGAVAAGFRGFLGGFNGGAGGGAGGGGGGGAGPEGAGGAGGAASVSGTQGAANTGAGGGAGGTNAGGGAGGSGKLYLTYASAFPNVQPLPVKLDEVWLQTSGSVNSATATFANPQQLGCTNIVIVGWLTGNSLTTVTDSSGNTYTQVAQVNDSSNQISCAVFIASNIKAHTAGNVVTVNNPGGFSFPGVGIYQFTPCSVDAANVLSQDFPTTATALTIGPTFQARRNEYRIGVWLNNTPGTAFVYGPWIFDPIALFDIVQISTADEDGSNQWGASYTLSLSWTNPLPSTAILFGLYSGP